ncbi:MAG: hypothetical protein CMJ78_05115 [Planctomycetaceae bacterium]|nr:hypothetical protein [Planctomycetaceae bacterium]
MRRLTAIVILSSVATCGCATRGSLDVLEAQMREYEARVASLESELKDSQADLLAVRKESESLRSQLSVDGKTAALLPEQAQLLTKVSGIRFHKLLTAAQDTDDQPGDDTVNAVLMPVDDDSETLKLPGVIQIKAYDFTQRSPSDNTTAPKEIGSWEYTLDESRKLWNKGFLASGYHFKLKWREPPTGNELLMHARLTTTDGRRFDTTKLLRVNSPAISTSEPELVPPPVSELQPVSRTTNRPTKEHKRPLPFQELEISPEEEVIHSDARRDWEFPTRR